MKLLNRKHCQALRAINVTQKESQNVLVINSIGY